MPTILHNVVIRDEDDEPVIDPYNSEPVTKTEIQGPRVWISIYFVVRCYGGPEEGGWWYNAGEIQRTFRVPLRHVSAVAARVQAACDRENEGEPGLGSVMSGGEYQVHVGRAPGEDFPRRRPYYC